jgi:hypothetical protein
MGEIEQSNFKTVFCVAIDRFLVTRAIDRTCEKPTTCHKTIVVAIAAFARYAESEGMPD